MFVSSVVAFAAGSNNNQKIYYFVSQEIDTFMGVDKEGVNGAARNRISLTRRHRREQATMDRTQVASNARLVRDCGALAGVHSIKCRVPTTFGTFSSPQKFS